MRIRLALNGLTNQIISAIDLGYSIVAFRLLFDFGWNENYSTIDSCPTFQNVSTAIL